MKVGIIRCMQTEDFCPGTTDFRMIREKKGAFEGVEEDIEIIWTALGGKTKVSDDNSFIYAEIRVYEDNKLIFNEKINFVQKAFDIMQELENEEMRPMQ